MTYQCKDIFINLFLVKAIVYYVVTFLTIVSICLAYFLAVTLQVLYRSRSTREGTIGDLSYQAKAFFPIPSGFTEYWFSIMPFVSTVADQIISEGSPNVLSGIILIGRFVEIFSKVSDVFFFAATTFFGFNRHWFRVPLAFDMSTKSKEDFQLAITQGVEKTLQDSVLKGVEKTLQDSISTVKMYHDNLSARHGNSGSRVDTQFEYMNHHGNEYMTHAGNQYMTRAGNSGTRIDAQYDYMSPNYQEFIPTVFMRDNSAPGRRNISVIQKQSPLTQKQLPLIQKPSSPKLNDFTFAPEAIQLMNQNLMASSQDQNQMMMMMPASHHQGMVVGSSRPNNMVGTAPNSYNSPLLASLTGAPRSPGGKNRINTLSTLNGGI